MVDKMRLLSRLLTPFLGEFRIQHSGRRLSPKPRPAVLNGALISNGQAHGPMDTHRIVHAMATL